MKIKLNPEHAAAYLDLKRQADELNAELERRYAEIEEYDNKCAAEINVQRNTVWEQIKVSYGIDEKRNWLVNVVEGIVTDEIPPEMARPQAPPTPEGFANALKRLLGVLDELEGEDEIDRAAKEFGTISFDKLPKTVQ